MSDAKRAVCPGEILYASSYGGVEDYTFTNSIAVSNAWLDAVKERQAVVCEISKTLWIDFELNSELVMAEENENEEVDVYLLFARRYCYRKFCEKYCGYFGMTEIFGFLYRTFSHRHKEPPDDYDMAYAEFVDSLLEDVRFIVCLRRPDVLSEKGDEGEDKRISETTTPDILMTENSETPTREREYGKTLSIPNTLSDEYFEDDIMEMNLEKAYQEGLSAPSLSHRTLNATASTPKKGSSNRILSDYFVDSPMAAEIAPDTTLQEEAAADVTEMASMGFDSDVLETSTSNVGRHNSERNNDPNMFEPMPLTVLYDPSTGKEKVLGCEYGTPETSHDPKPNSTFVIDGLFEEPAPETFRNAVIEITYAVRSVGRVLTFTAIDVFNGFLKTTGNRGRIRFQMKDFVRAVRLFDPGARLLNPEQLDLYSFDFDLAGLQPESLLTRYRKLYLRFYHQE